MEDDAIRRSEKRRKWLLLAILVHLLLGVLLLLPLLEYQEPPPEREGVLVSFGLEAEGGGERPVSPAKTASETPSESIDEEKEVDDVPQERNNESIKEETEAQEIITSDDAAVIAAREKAKKDAAEREQAERAALEAQRRKEAAQRQKEAERIENARREAEYEASKNAFGSLLSGKGSTENKNTSEGDPEGEGHSDVLRGVSTGSGRVGGGLSSRGILGVPEVRENSQETGVVVIQICVNALGKVTSARYTQRGSTTQSALLKKKALEAARKYRFTSSEIEEQCGQVTFDFKVK